MALATAGTLASLLEQERQGKVGIPPRRAADLVRKVDLALEAALRQLEAMNDGGARLGRQRAVAGDDQPAALNAEFDLLRVDPWQGDEDQHGVLGLEHVDRRLPIDAARAVQRRREDLAMKPLGPRQHLQRFRPHPVPRIVRHGASYRKHGRKLTPSRTQLPISAW